mmetsp:Transcript_6630/g.14451  ORF Transcript_6630/g.14451 Transcript_6630/m.14451 type:complete len:246 (-) Transcript_6630:169-906(-)
MFTSPLLTLAEGGVLADVGVLPPPGAGIDFAFGIGGGPGGRAPLMPPLGRGGPHFGIAGMVMPLLIGGGGAEEASLLALAAAAATAAAAAPAGLAPSAAGVAELELELEAFGTAGAGGGAVDELLAVVPVSICVLSLPPAELPVHATWMVAAFPIHGSSGSSFACIAFLCAISSCCSSQHLFELISSSFSACCKSMTAEKRDHVWLNSMLRPSAAAAAPAAPPPAVAAGAGTGEASSWLPPCNRC